MKIRFYSYAPKRFDKSECFFNFFILPGLNFLWIGGVQVITFCWLFWQVQLDFDRLKAYDKNDNQERP